jgi:type II secretory pathway component PulC
VKIKAVILTFIFVSVISVSFSEAVFKYDAKDKRDPLTPLIDKEGNLLPEYRPASTAVTLHLEGIVWSGEGDSYAIISGTVLRAGETIGDHMVKKIERSRVILNRAGEDSVINLRGEEE